MKTITFGEIMMRLIPNGNKRFIGADNFEVNYGGAEANVAASLAVFGTVAKFVTALPLNELGDAALGRLRAFNVNTDGIIRRPGRLGIYYLERGASQRPGKVIYDRADSAFSRSRVSDYDWDSLLSGTDFFCFTGITPALSPELAEACLTACRTAKRLGVTVVFDVNYRSKLWSVAEAVTTLGMLLPYVDICITNEAQAAEILGVRIRDDYTKGIIDKRGYTGIAEKLISQYGFSAVALTIRDSVSADRNRFGGMLYREGKAYFSDMYDIEIVDRVGAGDSFTAGLIYGLGSGMNDNDAIKFAAAAGCLKHSIEGDFNCSTVGEVKALASGDGSGSVKR